MIYPKQQLCTASVKNSRYLNEKTLELEFLITRPENFTFIPGQFISLKVSDVNFRAYSIVSEGYESEKFKIVLTVAHDGIGANYAKILKSGDEVTFIGPSGRFHLSQQLPQNLLFLVTGTGIAPILSMLKQLQVTKYSGNIKLYFGLRSIEDIFYENLLKDLKSRLTNFDYYICISNPDTLWNGLKGRITDHYKVSDVSATEVYLCGNPNMILEMQEKLAENGFLPHQIRFEKFTLARN